MFVGLLLGFGLGISSGLGAEWVDLFDGKSLEGWEKQSEVNWRVEDGAITCDKGKVGLLTSEKRWMGYELELEFRAAEGTNSGVFLSTPKKVSDPATECYELNIAPPDHPFPTGSLVGRVKHAGAGGAAEWRKYRVVISAGRVRVWLDGKPIVDYRDPEPLAGGYIGLQFNEGEVAFRGIRIREAAAG